MSKKGTYNIHDVLPFGKVIWGINPKMETVTCILFPIEQRCELISESSSPWGTMKFYDMELAPMSITKKTIKTTKASHGDTFDIDTGMARSLFKCMVSAGLFKNLTSWNKVKKTIRRIEDDRDKATVREQIDCNQRPVSDKEGQFHIGGLNQSIDSITEVSGDISKAGKQSNRDRIDAGTTTGC